MNAFEELGDGRRVTKDLDSAMFFESIEPAKRAYLQEFKKFLDGSSQAYDNIDQILDDFAWLVRFEVLWLKEREEGEQ